MVQKRTLVCQSRRIVALSFVLLAPLAQLLPIAALTLPAASVAVFVLVLPSWLGGRCLCSFSQSIIAREVISSVVDLIGWEASPKDLVVPLIRRIVTVLGLAVLYVVDTRYLCRCTGSALSCSIAGLWSDLDFPGLSTYHKCLGSGSLQEDSPLITLQLK
jgi:hypothetical protein